MDDLDQRYREMFGTDLFRPRDEFDVDIHPESVRGKALALMDAQSEVLAQITATRRGRLLWAAARAWTRVRRAVSG